MKEEKARRREARERKKGLTSDVAIKPTSSKKGQGSKKTTKLSNPGSQKDAF